MNAPTLPAELPQPLVPAEVDLRGLEYMPLLGTRLFASDFNLDANDAEFRVGLRLWWAAWGQVPAASLPSEDHRIQGLAGLAENPAKWKKVRARALQGFVKCSDGRLYHPIVAEQALIAWEKRSDHLAEKEGNAERKSRERAERAQMFSDLKNAGVTPPWNIKTGELRKLVTQHVTQPVTQPVTKGATEPVTVTVTAKTVRDGTVRDEEERTEDFAGRGAGARDDPPDDAQPTAAGLLCRALIDAGIGRTNPGHPRLLALLAAGATSAEFLAFTDKAKDMDDPFAYLLGCVEGERKRAKRTGAEVHKGRLPSKQEAIEQRNRAAADEWLAQQGTA